jgi:hypothetical protein
MSKNTILIIVLLLSIAGFYIFHHSDVRRQMFKAIPDSGILAIETAHAKKMHEHLVQNKAYSDWGKFALVNKFETGFTLLDSLFLLKKPNNQSSLLASLHQTKADDYDFVFFTTPEALQQPLADIIDSLAELGIYATERNFKRQTIYELTFPKQKQVFTIVQDGKIVLASLTPLLVDEALTQYHRLFTGKFLRFQSQKPTGDAHFTLYLLFENLPLFKTIFLKSGLQETVFDWPAQILNWATYEVSLQDNRIDIQGKTFTKPNLLLTQIVEQNCPNSINIAGVLPYNTALLWYNRANDVQKIVRQQKQELFASSDELDWVGQEWAFGFTEPASANMYEVAFAAIAIADSSEAVRSLSRLAKKGTKPITFKGINIGTANCSEIVQLLFGKDYSPAFTQSYYAQLDNFMLFSGSKEHLQVIIENYLAKQTLLKNEHYKLFEKDLKLQSNTFLYVQPEGFTPLIKATASTSFLNDVTQKSKYYKGFTPITVQLNELPDNQILTTARINYSQAKQKKESIIATTTLAWSVDLEDEPAATPQIVRNHINGEREILAFDKSNNLYLISKNGRILWKRQFDKPILGKVQQLDLYNNGNLFYLFNTTDKVYLIDRNSKDVQDYPIKLSALAVNGLTLADFEDNKNYSYFIPCGNNNIYGYHPNGRPLSGWSPRPYLALMAFELKHFQHSGKQMMMATNSNGNIYLLAPNGELKQKLVAGSPLISPPQVDIRSGEPKIVATAKNSKTYVFTLDGKKWEKKMVSISPTSGFFTDNIQPDDPNEEYVFMSNNTVYVFGEKKKIFDVVFKDQAKPNKIFPIRLSGEKNTRIGVFCQNTQQIFLLDGKGLNHPDFPISAATPFICTDLLDNGGNILIAGGTARNLFAYTIQ